MKGKRAATHEQRRERRRKDRRSHSDRWTVTATAGPPCGPDVTVAGLDEVLAAIEELPPADDWEAAAGLIVPAFERLRPQPYPDVTPLRAVVPPGLSISFAMDIGPAIMTIGEGQLKTWGVTVDEVSDRAFANLARRMSETSARDVVHTTIDDVPFQALQVPDGHASTFVLLPHLLGRIFGTAPQLLFAPMRNLLFSMPLAADRDLAAFVFGEVASQDPNALVPTAFAFRDGTVTPEPLGPAFGGD